MKKLLQILAIAFVLATAFTACSEEQVTPDLGTKGHLETARNNDGW